jgi:hypothetical protein
MIHIRKIGIRWLNKSYIFNIIYVIFGMRWLNK